MDYIKEGRKIAEFMGYRYIGWNNTERSKYDTGTGYWMKENLPTRSWGKTRSIMKNPPPFHNDWNYTMMAAKYIFKTAELAEIYSPLIGEMLEEIKHMNQPGTYRKIIEIINAYQNKQS